MYVLCIHAYTYTYIMHTCIHIHVLCMCACRQDASERCFLAHNLVSYVNRCSSSIYKLNVQPRSSKHLPTSNNSCNSAPSWSVASKILCLYAGPRVPRGILGRECSAEKKRKKIQCSMYVIYMLCMYVCMHVGV